MARPTNKKELLDLSTANYKKLLALIESTPIEYKDNIHDFNERDKTISDVICHLHVWHLMMNKWYIDGMSGKKPVMPSEGYTWKTLPAYNQTVWEKYQNTSLKDALKMFSQSHTLIMELIEKHSDDELFIKQKYKWTGSTSLGAYFISSTSSHYDWGLKTLKPLKKLI